MKNYKFCPYCSYKNIKHDEYFDCEKCNKKVFINSIPTAGVFLINDGRYTLCTRAIEPEKGKLDVIGGFLKNGEAPETAVVREVKEETGINIKKMKLICIYPDKYFYQNEEINTLVLYYVSETSDLNLKPADDISSIEWYSINNIPENLAFTNIKLAIKDLQKWYKKTSNLQ